MNKVGHQIGLGFHNFASTFSSSFPPAAQVIKARPSSRRTVESRGLQLPGQALVVHGV